MSAKILDFCKVARKRTPIGALSGRRGGEAPMFFDEVTKSVTFGPPPPLVDCFVAITAEDVEMFRLSRVVPKELVATERGLLPLYSL